jgi:hypothetical protein
MRVKRRFKPCNLNGCVLYLPFYAYGGNAQVIWDLSGQGNHGTITGAAPGSYPILAGQNLVTNGGMETGDPPTEWNPGDTPETFEQSGVQKHSGSYSAHLVDSTPSYAYFYQQIAIAPLKKIKLSFWYYQVSGNSQTWVLTPGFIESLYSFGFNVDGAWTYHEAIFATSTTVPNIKILFRNLSAAASAEFYIDDVRIEEITGYESLGWSFNGSSDRVVHSSLNLGTIHTLHYWLQHQGTSGVVHGGANTYHGLKINDGIGVVGYNAGATEVTVSHNGTGKSQWKTLFSIVRSGASVIFYQDGAKIGATQTLDANNDLTVTDFGRYSNGTSYFKGIIFESLALTRSFSAEEVKSYFDLTRSRYGV